MISGSKVQIRFELARKCVSDFMTHPTCATKVRNVGGLWECEARNNPDIGF